MSDAQAVLSRNEDGSPLIEPLLDIRQLSKILGMSEKTLYEWGKTGRIPVYLVGGTIVRYRISEIEAWLTSFHVEATK